MKAAIKYMLNSNKNLFALNVATIVLARRERLAKESLLMAEQMVQECMVVADHDYIKSIAFSSFSTKGRNGILKVPQLLLRSIFATIDKLKNIRVIRILSGDKKVLQQLKKYVKANMINDPLKAVILNRILLPVVFETGASVDQFFPFTQSS